MRWGLRTLRMRIVVRAGGVPVLRTHRERAAGQQHEHDARGPGPGDGAVGREAGEVALTGAAAWRHAFGDVEPASRAAFASAPASTFAVRGAPVSEDALVLVETGTDEAPTFPGWTLLDSRDYAAAKVSFLKQA